MPLLIDGLSIRAGNYTATVTQLTTGNYVINEADLDKNFTIEKRPIEVISTTGPFIYNGEGQAPTFTLNNGLATCKMAFVFEKTEGDGTYESYTSTIDSTNWATSFEPDELPKDAGSYKITITNENINHKLVDNDGNEVEKLEVSYTIDPMPVQITWTPDIESVVYDGQDHLRKPAVAAGYVVEGDTCNVVYNVTDDATVAIKVGTYETTATGVNNPNYTLADSAQTIATVTITARSLYIIADDAEKVYDGTELTANTYTISGDTSLAADDSIHSITITGSQKNAGSSYNVASDVYINWAASYAIVNGYNNQFNPDANITRQELAAIMHRYAAYKEVANGFSADLTTYGDVTDVATWATEDMSWAVGAGIINGCGVNGQTLLVPKANAMRSEVATVFLRYVVNVANHKADVTDEAA